MKLINKLQEFIKHIKTMFYKKVVGNDRNHLILDNRFIRKFKIDEIYYEMRFMDIYDKAPKWLLFYTITGFFICALFTFNRDMSNKDSELEYIEYFKVNGILFAVYGTIVSIWLSLTKQLESTRLYHEKVINDRRNNSWKLMEKWDSDTIMEARDFTREIKARKNAITNDDLIKEIEESDVDESDKHKNLKRSLISCYNFFETLKTTMDNELSDKEMLKDSFQDVFVDIYTRFEPYTKKYKMTHNNNVVDKLYDEWK